MQEQRYANALTYHYAQRMCTVYNFHAYTLRFRCLPLAFLSVTVHCPASSAFKGRKRKQGFGFVPGALLDVSAFRLSTQHDGDKAQSEAQARGKD